MIEQLKSGELVPFIGMGVFKDTKNDEGGQVPYDSDSMILALNEPTAQLNHKNTPINSQFNGIKSTFRVQFLI